MHVKSILLAAASSMFVGNVLAADCKIGVFNIIATDYKIFVDHVVNNLFDPPLADTLSLGAFQSQPFFDVGTAGICVENDNPFTVNYNLADFQLGVQQIFDQCFTTDQGDGGDFTINGDRGSVVLHVHDLNTNPCL